MDQSFQIQEFLFHERYPESLRKVDSGELPALLFPLSDDRSGAYRRECPPAEDRGPVRR